MEFISALNEPPVSDDKEFINFEDYDFANYTPITTPIINADIASTHSAVTNTTDNNWKTFFSECISAGHSDMPSVYNNANTEHMNLTHQEPVINVDIASTHPAVTNTTDNNWKTFFSECISPGHSDMPSVFNNANTEHVKQTRKEQQMVLYSAGQDQQMFSSRPPSQSKRKAISKIPRPPNAFLIFANRWRRTLAMQYPLERNKDISVRLGAMWKSMSREEKDVYVDIACKVHAEHKRKYPNYVYCPKEARIRKALRMGGRYQKNLNKKGHLVAATFPSGSACQLAPQLQQSWNIHHPALLTRGTSRQPLDPHSLLASRIIAEQQRSLQETKITIREQEQQGMSHGSTKTYKYI